MLKGEFKSLETHYTIKEYLEILYIYIQKHGTSIQPCK